jgi:hypothetical protein
MVFVASGKRAGTRRAAKRAPSFQPSLLPLALGVTVAVVAWGYLVYAAIDFGSTARSGDTRAWGFLALASAGAVACLFVGLMLISRLLRRLGITQDPSSSPAARAPRASVPVDPDPEPTMTMEIPQVPRPRSERPSRPTGGRRAAR